MKAIQKVKNVCAYSSHTCFIAADHWFLVFSVMLKNCLMQLHVGPCHVVSVEIAVLTENSANCEMRGVIRFLQADEILGYLAKEASSRLELYCCTECTSTYCQADASLAARAILLGHLRASSVQSRPDTVSLFFSDSKNNEYLKDAG